MDRLAERQRPALLALLHLCHEQPHGLLGDAGNLLAIDNIVTPLLSVLIATALTFLFIGPVMRTVGDAMTSAVMWLFFDLGALGGLIYGVTYPLLVITGMHHSLVTAETQILANIETLGGSPTFVVVACANCAQGAAALAVMFLAKYHAKMRSVASASGVSAWLGITEPAIFGVNLKLCFPFYAALIGGGIGAAYATMVQVLSVSQGPCGTPAAERRRPMCRRLSAHQRYGATSISD